MNNIFKILNKNELFFISLILVLSSLAIMLEFASLATITFFFSHILKVETNISLLDKIFQYNFNSPNSILIIIITIFFIKSSFLFFLSIFEFMTYKRIRLRLSEKLVNQFIKPNFDLDIIDSSATKIWKIEIINNFSGLISHIILFIRNFGYIIIIIFFVTFYSSISVIYFILALFVFLIIYYFTVSKKLKKTGEYLSIGAKEKINIIQDIINGIKDINILKRFNYFIKKFNSSNIKYEKFTQENLIFSNFPINYLEFFGVLIIVLYFFFLKNQKMESIEILMHISLITYAGLRVINLMKTCANSLNFYTKSSFVISVLFDEFKKKLEISNNLNSIKYNQHLKDGKVIIISNLHYNYQNGKKIFSNLNLEFEINKIYCLKGKSGSGKSTFLDIILGIKSISAGELLVKYNNSQIGYVSQECYIKEDTIKNNIAFGIDEAEIDNKNIVIAAKEAQIYNYINSLPLKFETKLNTFGSNISIGQKKRIGIARVLYNNSKILLLDEPTSSLDHDTAENFLKTLKEIKKEKLIIMTSHQQYLENYVDNFLEINDDGSINFSKK